MLSKIVLTFSKDTENRTKFMVDNKMIKLTVYYIKRNWYIDIADNERDLLIGKIINSWIDLFELLKIYDKAFPDIKFTALPINVNGIDKEFVEDIPGVLQELYLMKEEWYG